MKRLCAFDIETDGKGEALISGGWAVDTADPERPQKGVCDAKHVGDLIEQLSLAEVLVGHNIIDFDLPFLLQRFPATMQAAVTSKDIIDTLYLSPIAFPRNPYHYLYKDYKPYPLSQNRPDEDSVASRELLAEEEQALTDLPGEARSVLMTLLERCPKTSAFTARLSREFRRLTQSQMLMTVQAYWGSRLCIHALPDVVRQAWDDGMAAWALAVVLAWIEAEDGVSVIGQWPREQTPFVVQFLHALRASTCNDAACSWCRSFGATECLHRLFDFDEFRPNQQVIVEAALAGDNILAILPTGGGKSLCFQLPALMQALRGKQLTVILTPLVSLMQDQVTNLRQRFQIPNVALLGSGLSMLERKDVFDQVRLGNVDLLFLSPEQLRNHSTVELLASREIGRWVIDEAHCISQWGHNFRVDYTYIPTAIKSITGTTAPISCFTATAKREVIEEIEQQFASCTDRPFRRFAPEEERTNLSYHVKELSEDRKKPELLHILEANDGPAIVYTRTRAKSEDVANFLLDHDISADFYHAGLDAQTRAAKQQAFQDGEVRVMVATTAFGMGIDKKDVRTVVLVDAPDSLEAYVQEIGRAGRDGLPSATVAIYSEADIGALYNMLLSQQISRKDLVGIFSALRTRARDAGSERLELTAGEIIEGDDGDLSFSASDRDYETRTKVAIHFLEMQDAVTRGLNRSQAVAVKLLMSKGEALSLLEKSVSMTTKTKAIATYLFDKFEVASSDDATSGTVNTDRMLVALGVERQLVWTTMQTMHDLKILEYSMQLRLTVRARKTNEILPELDLLTTQMKALYAALLEDAAHSPQGTEPSLSVTVDADTMVPRVETASKTVITEKSRLYELLTALSCTKFLKFSKRQHGRFFVTLASPENDASASPLSMHALDAQCLGTVRAMQEFLLLAKNSSEKCVTVDAVQLAEQLHLGASSAGILDAGVRLLSLLHFVTLLDVPGLFSPIMSLQVHTTKKVSTIHGQDLKAMQDEQFFKVRAVEQYCLQMLQKRMGIVNIFGDARASFLTDYFRLTEKEFIKVHLADVEDSVYRPVTWQRSVAADTALKELSPEQARVLNAKEDAVMVLAGPGSGKTRLLVAKVVALITEERVNPATILVLVYNHAARQEIRRRLRGILGETALAVHVCTFHSFALDEVCHINVVDILRGEHKEQGFKDAITQAADILERHAEVERLELPYRYVLIDEYQDITADQYRMVSALVGRLRESGERQYIFAVGDDDQNIYAYSGADIRHIREFENDYDAVQYGLSVNFRSLPEVVTFANRLIEQNRDRMKKEMRLTAHDAQPSSQPHSVWWAPFHSRAEESAAILGLLRQSSDRSVAILGRTNNDVAHIRWTLHHEGIAFADLNQRRCGYLPLSLWLLKNELIANPNQLYDAPALKAMADEVQRTQHLRDWQMREAHDWITDLAATEPEALTGQDLLHDLVRWTFEPSTSSTRTFGQGPHVFVDTMHKSKGTEFDDVILVGTRHLEITEDERRVWYVACTRARSRLILVVPPCEQPLLGSLLIPPLAYRWDAKPAIPPAALPREVWSYQVNPADAYLGFITRKPDDRDVPDPLRDLDADSLHIIRSGGKFVLCTADSRLTMLSQKGAAAAKSWPCDPTTMHVESPRTYVRETADEQNFITLATLTAVQ
ncbi:RecQ family ATP-dependent DNA helicase [bacterium]|nr:RecQ family ATP-dependent DNA helicase [bacterium]